MKTRYAADYTTQEAVNKAIDESPDAWSDLVEYFTISGENLEKVVAEAKSKNQDRGECYSARLEQFEYGHWGAIEYYDCFTLEQAA